jgi:hypothetical protein
VTDPASSRHYAAPGRNSAAMFYEIAYTVNGVSISNPSTTPELQIATNAIQNSW